MKDIRSSVYVSFIFSVIGVCLCLYVCECGVSMEQSTNIVWVRSLIPIGSIDANDACTLCMMNAMELNRGASVQWHMLNS